MEIDDELGMRLHDRATRGQPLAPEEQAQLQAWYDAKDREEAEMLRSNSPLWREREERDDLDSTIQLAISRLDELIRQNHVLAAQNEKLISLIESLQRSQPSRASQEHA